MRTNYVLIDFENVQPVCLERLRHEQFKLLVFVGANQTKIPFEVAASLQRLGTRAEYVKISGNGPNSLDFHIAFYIGLLAAAEPSAYFHIISKDTGFDPLLQHLKTKNVLARRSMSIDEIPLLKPPGDTSPSERMELVLTRLQRMKTARPRTVKTLSSTIHSLFQKQLSESEVTELVNTMAKQGILSIADTKVVYALPDHIAHESVEGPSDRP